MKEVIEIRFITLCNISCEIFTKEGLERYTLTPGEIITFDRVAKGEAVVNYKNHKLLVKTSDLNKNIRNFESHFMMMH